MKAKRPLTRSRAPARVQRAKPSGTAEFKTPYGAPVEWLAVTRYPAGSALPNCETRQTTVTAQTFFTARVLASTALNVAPEHVVLEPKKGWTK